MNPLLNCLYQHTLEHLEPGDPEYQENRRCSAKKLSALEATLNEHQAQLLTDYLYMHELASDAEQEAMFRDALIAGLYFGSLCRLAE